MGLKFVCFAGVLANATCAPLAHAVAITWQQVGLPNNAPDPTNNLGSVPYTYAIARHEVTNAQYAEFLNAKGALAHGANVLALYEPLMSTGEWPGIDRAGAGTLANPYHYTTKPSMGDKPVNYVSYYNALRFANWINNGQGAGDTESGAYTLLGNTAFPTNGKAVARNANAQVFIPSANEWYKAAYYEPGASDDNYWTFATRSDNPPTPATTDATGTISNPGPNVANYNYGATWNDIQGGPTTVGSAGPQSESYFGTADQSGNVFEYTDYYYNNQRILIGGSWADSDYFQRAGNVTALFPLQSNSAFGFRLATILPEPGSFASLAALLLLIQGSRSRRTRSK